MPRHQRLPWSRACRIARSPWCCTTPPRPRRMRSRSRARYAALSIRLPFIAANERFRMTLEIIREHPDRSSRAANFVERLVQILDLRGIRPGQIAGVVERALRTRQRAARTCQRQIEIGDRLVQIISDLLQGHLVEFLDDVFDSRLGTCKLSRSSW